MTRITGQPLLRHIVQHPLSVLSKIRDMARLHADIHHIDGQGLPDQKAFYLHHIKKAKLPGKLHQCIVDRLQAIPVLSHMCHGDYHPGNIIVAANGLTAIDWDKVQQGDPAADVARTITLLRFGRHQFAFPATMEALVRRFLANRYRSAYLQAVQGAGENVAQLTQRTDRWLPITMAAKYCYSSKKDQRLILRLLHNEFEE